MFRGPLLAVSIAVAVIAGAVTGGAQELAQSTEQRLKQNAMTVFIAEGPPNSCGPGCDRWIAAEGSLDPGSAKRVIEFLEEHKKSRLPIYFHSTGGLTGQAIEIGQHLRRLRMRAGVGRTALRRCAGTATSKDCRRLVETTSDRMAQLRLNEGLCASACVYAFVGASSRVIDPQARIGVHASVPTRNTEKGIVTVAPSRLTPEETSARARHLLKLWRHVSQMGVDPGLVDFATKVDPRTVRFLTRNELIRFGVATTDGFETPWIGRDEKPSAGYSLFKLLVRRSPEDKSVYLTTTVGLTCYRSDRVTVFIEREMAPGETGNEPLVRVLGDEKVTWISTTRMNTNFEVDYRAQIMPFENVLKVVPKRSFELKLEYTSPEWADKSHTIKLSIAGLETVIAKMRKQCDGLQN